MHLVDSNVWVAMTLSRHVHHQAAREWLDSVRAPASVAFCRATQESYLRLLTTAPLFERYGNKPLTNREAWKTYDALLADHRIVLVEAEPRDLEEHWRQFTDRNTASKRLFMDGYLAAFAAGNGWELITTDSGFRQFPGVRVKVLGTR